MRVLSALALVVALGTAAATARSAAGTGPTRLQITVWPRGAEASEVHRYRLTCGPAAGTVPHPARACAVLARLGAAAFAPVPRTEACTDIYGGPQQARVRGFVGGRSVDARLSRVNGCEIDRWNKVVAVVPLPPSST